MSDKRPDAAIVFTVAKNNQRSADGVVVDKPQSSVVQSLFNDGTESAV